MERKAQGIGINIIIIAAIALLVLIIIAVLVAQSGGEVRRGLESCSVNGGICVSNSAVQPDIDLNDYRVSTEYACDDGFTCYVPTGQ